MDTGIIGPITNMKGFNTQLGPLPHTIHALVVTSILMPAALSCLFAARFADDFSREGEPIGIAIAAAIFSVALVQQSKLVLVD